ncbi:MAG: hypothetical protein U0165_17085, partial [Polyangiaceae bacterium]
MNDPRSSIRVSSRIAWAMLPASMALLGACSIPDRTLLPAAGSAGAGGTGATGGTAGDAGSSGSAGTAGVAGSAGTAGAAGTAGSINDLSCSAKINWRCDGNGNNYPTAGPYNLVFGSSAANWFTPTGNADSLLNQSLGFPPGETQPPTCSDCYELPAARFVGAVTVQVWVKPGPGTVAGTR